MMARKSGISSQSLGKIQDELKGMKTPKNAAMGNKKVHTGRFVNDEAYDEETHDFGMWVMSPKSSRVSGFRYDFANESVHVQWRDGGPSYVYTEVPFEIYEAMVRSPSKGKFINSTLGSYDYRRADPAEEDAPSNVEHRAPAAKVQA